MTEPVAPAGRFAWQDFSWLGDLNSFLVSTAVHLVAFVGIGLLSLSAQHGFEQGNLIVQLGDGNDAVAGEEGRLEGIPDTHPSAAESDASVAQAANEVLTPQAVASRAIESDASSLAPAQLNDAEVFGDSKSIDVDDATAAKALDRALAAKSGLGGHG